MVLLKTNVVQIDHIDMYTNKFLNFVSMYLAIMTDKATCDELADNLFAGSDKVTILTDYPASITQEPNQFEPKNPGLFRKIKNVISGWISPSKSDDDTTPEMKLKEGTYSCAGNSCTRMPGDESINYERIKEDSVRITEPGENELMRDGRRDVHFIDPPEIIRIIDPREMIDALEKGYQEKQRKKRQ